MSTLNLSDLSAPLAALRMLTVDFPLLPAPTVDVSTLYPERLTLTFHDGFAEFEAWREALNIDPASVVHRVQRDGRTGVLDVHTVFSGSEVRLTAYAEVPAPEPVPAGTGVAQ